MRTSESTPKSYWSAWAVAWLSIRLVIAVAVTSAVFSWGYHYVYEASAFKDSVTIPTGQFQDFLATAIGLLGLGLVPAIIAVLIQITGTHRSWRRIVAATVIPNVIGGVGMAFIVYGGGDCCIDR